MSDSGCRKRKKIKSKSNGVEWEIGVWVCLGLMTIDERMKKKEGKKRRRLLYPCQD